MEPLDWYVIKNMIIEFIFFVALIKESSKENMAEQLHSYDKQRQSFPSKSNAKEC